MPKRKRSYAPKRRPFRRVRRTIRRKSRMRVHRPMRPSTYNFTRSFVETINLNSTSPPTGWTVVENGLCRSQPFDISQLPNYSEFSNLFMQYRLKAVKQEYYFSDTGSVNHYSQTHFKPSVDSAATSYNNSGNKQIMMYTNPNAVGVNNTSSLTEGFFMESQVAKKRLCLKPNPRPITIYAKLHQLTDVYSSELGSTDYAKSRPKFISTGETKTQHYGIDVRLQRIDGQEFSFEGSVYPSVKIITKIYLQCRQVK